jgi:hypothetical protein
MLGPDMGISSRESTRVAASIAVAAATAFASLPLGACTSGDPASPGLEADTPSEMDASAGDLSYVCPGLEAGVPACPAPPPSYENQVKGIVETWCGPCHFPGGDGITKGGNNDYSTLTGFSERTTITLDVFQCRMPLSTSPPLPAAEWETLLEWLACNEPDN